MIQFCIHGFRGIFQNATLHQGVGAGAGVFGWSRHNDMTPAPGMAPAQASTVAFTQVVIFCIVTSP